jgi:hypothetical protein
LSNAILHIFMFHNPRAPYTTSNNFTNFTPNFYTRPYILSHVVPTFFASGPPEGGVLGWPVVYHKGKPSGLGSESTSAFFHLRCRFRCRCKILAQSPWHNSNVDELCCRRCKIPCISSSYAGSLLSAKGQKLC